MSQEKVAEITKVNKSTVSRWVAQTIKLQGSNPELDYLSGVALKNFVTYLALDAKRITPEVRNHNIKLLSDAGDLGFQNLIDKMAGIIYEPEPPTLKSSDLALILESIQSLKAYIDSTKMKLSQEEKDKEHYKAMTFALYPSHEKMQKIGGSLKYFDRIEPILNDISEKLKKINVMKYLTIKDMTKGKNLTHGQKIQVSRMVSDWLKLSSSQQILELKKYQNTKKLYPECIQPLVDLAVGVVLDLYN